MIHHQLGTKHTAPRLRRSASTNPPPPSTGDSPPSARSLLSLAFKDRRNAVLCRRRPSESEGEREREGERLTQEQRKLVTCTGVNKIYILAAGAERRRKSRATNTCTKRCSERDWECNPLVCLVCPCFCSRCYFETPLLLFPCPIFSRRHLR